MAVDNLDWFIALSEQESFTKAAERLQISQQTLSARLVALEKTLEVKLVSRGIPLSLTPAGTVVLLYAREQRQAREEMMRQIGEVTGSGAGVLKVGISHVRSQLIMPEVTLRMAKLLPKVRLQIVEGTNRELLRMAERAEVDVVVARFDDIHPGVDVSPLYEEEIVLALHAKVLEAAMDMSAEEALERVQREGVVALADCPFVLGSLDDIAGRVAYSVLRNAGIKPHVIATSNNMATLLAMAQKGLGAVFCPTDVLGVNDDSQQLVRVSLSKQARYTISLGVPQKNEEEWHTLSVFKDVLEKAIERL